MADDNHVPASPDAYLPTIVGHPGATVDVADSRYISARAAAHKAGLSQGQFSQMLGFEASRVVASQAKPAPAAATATVSPATPAKAWKDLSFNELMVRGGHI